MEYEDRLTINTPEGVDLSLSLAGVGSRCGAAMVDLTIQGALIAALAFVLGQLDGLGSGYVTAAVLSVLSFLVIFGYDVTWEVWGAGRTPGKRMLRLRVVRSSGAPIGFRASAVRNLLRLVDMLPGLYFAGFVVILATPRNQRLGDLAADSVVVHDAPLRAPRKGPAPARGARVTPAAAAWDVSAITADDLATVRSFLERRHQLTPQARERLAAELAARLRPKVAGTGASGGDEQFLSALAAVKASRA